MQLSRMAALAALSSALLIAAAKAPPRKPAKKPPARPAEPAPAVIVERWMHSMTLPEKIAQLIVMPIYGESIHTRSRVFKQCQDAPGLQEARGIAGRIPPPPHGASKSEPWGLATACRDSSLTPPGQPVYTDPHEGHTFVF